MKEPIPPPSPSPAATVAMDTDLEEERYRSEQLQCLLTGDPPCERKISPVLVAAAASYCVEGERPSSSGVETAAAMPMLSVEVVVDEVEPHSVQVPYSQVCSSCH